MPDVDVANTSLLPAGGAGWQGRLRERLKERLGPVRSGRAETVAEARRRIVT
ncbi:putative undecaprenyl-phosphate galactosephosphotransferase, partial [Methylorubrum extorquens DSM 13060]